MPFDSNEERDSHGKITKEGIRNEWQGATKGGYITIIPVFRKPRWKEQGQRGGIESEKKIKIYHVHVPISHNKCNHYVSQTLNNNNKN